MKSGLLKMLILTILGASTLAACHKQLSSSLAIHSYSFCRHKKCEGTSSRCFDPDGLWLIYLHPNNQLSLSFKSFDTGWMQHRRAETDPTQTSKLGAFQFSFVRGSQKLNQAWDNCHTWGISIDQMEEQQVGGGMWRARTGIAGWIAILRQRVPSSTNALTKARFQGTLKPQDLDSLTCYIQDHIAMDLTLPGTQPHSHH